ncbi:hypothetical protein DERP_011136 [Dermatophagoides pteronyssinus]|uniref:U24-ctenitoxin-Pn1a-like n=2 Tax=Dermatophagoides pteronyssinus TaxID=6956 RepID=A0A6P6Y8A8_DERPT|nr:U24-ctenitoxin-Pn1a-like [Dermatophagoides pteronyssinus]KAH9419041.1 hypothetical protein DERP_011136 [Dermatophagoides pteronyssinus]
MFSKLMILMAMAMAITIVSAQSKSECQLQKEKEDKKENTPLKLDVRCLENGDYAPLQCFPESKFCYCATPDGTQITQPSRNRKFCKCDLQKHEAEKGLSRNGRPIDPPSGSYIPNCARDGLFYQKQCEVGTGVCWCVNQEGSQTSKDKKVGITCA